MVAAAPQESRTLLSAQATMMDAYFGQLSAGMQAATHQSTVVATRLDVLGDAVTAQTGAHNASCGEGTLGRVRRALMTCPGLGPRCTANRHS